MTPVETKNTKSSSIEIEIQLNTDDARAKLDNLAAHVTAVNELLDGTLNRLERVEKTMPSKKFDAIQEMKHSLPPTESYIRSLVEMLKIACPLIDMVGYRLRPGISQTAGDGSEIKITYCSVTPAIKSLIPTSAAATAARPPMMRGWISSDLKLTRNTMPRAAPILTHTPHSKAYSGRRRQKAPVNSCAYYNNPMRVWRYRRRTDRCQQPKATYRKGCKRLNGHCAGRYLPHGGVGHLRGVAPIRPGGQACSCPLGIYAGAGADFTASVSSILTARCPFSLFTSS